MLHIKFRDKSYTKTSASDRRFTLSAISLALTILLLVSTGWLSRQMIRSGPELLDRQSNRQFYIWIGLGALAIFVTSYLFLPLLESWTQPIRARWRKLYTTIAVVIGCAFLGIFVFHFGNRQFGAYDFSILTDAGWRLRSGQRPYVDFVCTLPPAFYLGLEYAFKLFGVSWNAMLYATGLLAAAAFVCTFRLLNAITEAPASAFLASFAIVCAAVLTLDFWWYNNTTALAAAVFLLSCLAILKRPEAIGMQVSYVISLALLCLTKPNTAGLLVSGGVVLTFCSSLRKGLLAFLTALAALLALLILIVNGISLGGLIAGYLAAAKERGPLSLFGFRDMGGLFLVRFWISIAALAVPMLVWVPRFAIALRQGELRAVAHLLLYPLAVVVSVFAMCTNGELKDVEWAPWIAAGAVLVFSLRDRRAGVALLYTAFLCSLVVTDLYMGAIRFRVMGIGPHTFFEWQDAQTSPGIPFFGDMRASPAFRDTVSQIHDLVRTSPQPIFFGPRLEFAYAAFGLPSPKHIPVWWHPGTSFAVIDEPVLIRAWQNNNFATLIFLRDDFTYYSDSFLRNINEHFVRIDKYSKLTIFSRPSRREALSRY